MSTESPTVEPHWTAAITPELRPRRRDDVARASLGAETVLGSDEVNRPIVMDAVTTILWDSFQGRSPVRDIAEDLASLPGHDQESATRTLLHLVTALALDGYLVDPPGPGVPDRHATYPELRPRSCIAKKMHLDDAEPLSVDVGDAVLRLSCNDLGLRDLLRARLGDHLVPCGGKQTFAAVIAPARQTFGRGIHRLLDHGANPIASTTDPGVAINMLGRVVSDRLDMMEGGTWFEASLLIGPNGAIIAHKTLAGGLANLEPRLRRSGIHRHPSPYVQVDGPARVAVIKSNRFGDGPSEAQTVPICGVLLPASRRTHGDANLVRLLYNHARLWDQAHLDATTALVHPSDLVMTLPDEADLLILRDTIFRALATEPMA